jgi:hypothetical protein
LRINHNFETKTKGRFIRLTYLVTLGLGILVSGLSSQKAAASIDADELDRANQIEQMMILDHHPSEGYRLGSDDPDEADAALQAMLEWQARRDALSPLPDVIAEPDPDDPDKPETQAWSHRGMKWGYQAVVPNQRAAVAQPPLRRVPPPTQPPPPPPCPPDRNTGCAIPGGGTICCPGGQVAMGNACGGGAQLCCAKAGPGNCTQLGCRLSPTGGGGFSCASNNFICRDPVAGVPRGKCSPTAGGGPMGPGACPCIAGSAPAPIPFSPVVGE